MGSRWQLEQVGPTRSAGVGFSLGQGSSSQLQRAKCYMARQPGLQHRKSCGEKGREALCRCENGRSSHGLKERCVSSSKGMGDFIEVQIAQDSRGSCVTD